MRRLRLVVFSAAVFCMVAGLASANSLIFDDTVLGCAGLNCSSLRIPGSVIAFGPSASYFEVGLFASPGQCLRAEVISQGDDLEMVVRAPNGQIFRNDDKGAGPCTPAGSPLCPKVVINNTPNNGWYSTTLYRFNGAPTETNFVLLYGRYPLGNPNCGPATVPVVSSDDDVDSEGDKGSDDSAAEPRSGQPGAP